MAVYVDEFRPSSPGNNPFYATNYVGYSTNGTGDGQRFRNMGGISLYGGRFIFCRAARACVWSSGSLAFEAREAIEASRRVSLWLRVFPIFSGCVLCVFTR